MFGITDALGQRGMYQDVVNPPSHIPFPRRVRVGPPRVQRRSAGGLMPHGVYKTNVENRFEETSLRLGEHRSGLIL
jgi:hypothetical protein